MGRRVDGEGEVYFYTPAPSLGLTIRINAKYHNIKRERCFVGNCLLWDTLANASAYAQLSTLPRLRIGAVVVYAGMHLVVFR